MEWTEILFFTAGAIALIALGYFVGTRRARKLKKRLMQQHNQRSLDMLGMAKSTAELQAAVDQHEPREKLLSLALGKFQQLNQENMQLRQREEALGKKHFIELSNMRMRAVSAHETAKKAAAIAKKATSHLQRIEKASPVTQTIEAHHPKSYGSGEPVTVSVVDQASVDRAADAIVQVTNRDSVRLKNLSSSNEASAN